MGYESCFIVVRKTNSFFDGKRYGEYIASFTLGKIGGKPEVFRTATDMDFFFPGDGNTPVRVDRYDEPLYEAEIEDVGVWCCGEDAARFMQYSTFRSMMLYLMAVRSSENENLVVLHYGR